MKALHSFILLTIITAFFYSCDKSEVESCKPFDNITFEEKWTTSLTDFFEYKDAKWLDFGNDLLILTYSYGNNIIFVVDKENGKVKHSMDIPLLLQDDIRKIKIFVYKNLFVFSYFENIYVCNPYNSAIDIIKPHDMDGKIFVKGNKAFFASFQFDTYMDYVMVLDLDTYEIDTVTQKQRSGYQDYRFTSPFVYVSKAKDSILYCREKAYGSKNSDQTLIYNLKTKESKIIFTKGIESEYFLQDEDDLFFMGISYFKKLDPYTLDVQWYVKNYPFWIKTLPQYYFIGNDIIIFKKDYALSIKRQTGALKWKHETAGQTGNVYADVKNQILVKDYIFVLYQEQQFYKVINIKTGNFTGPFCDIPKELNGLAAYSTIDTLYTISYAKELSKYAAKQK